MADKSRGPGDDGRSPIRWIAKACEVTTMKCPHCGLIVTDQVPKCRGCGFSINDLDRRLRRVPARVGFVNDFAGVLSALRKTRIEAGLAQFHRSCGGDFVLVTVNSTQPVK